jgi:hypothetical protein
VHAAPFPKGRMRMNRARRIGLVCGLAMVLSFAPLTVTKGDGLAMKLGVADACGDQTPGRCLMDPGSWCWEPGGPDCNNGYPGSCEGGGNGWWNYYNF